MTCFHEKRYSSLGWVSLGLNAYYRVVVWLFVDVLSGSERSFYKINCIEYKKE
jgi:hypothetical protein